MSAFHLNILKVVPTTTKLLSSSSRIHGRRSYHDARQIKPIYHRKNPIHNDCRSFTNVKSLSLMKSSVKYGKTLRGMIRFKTTYRGYGPKLIRDQLLKARTLPIPRWITPRHHSFTMSELCGHGSFILVAIAYAVDDYVLLRIMAVAGSSSMLIFTFFHPHGRVQWLPFKWNILFIAINSYRIGKVFYEKYMAEFLDDNVLQLHETHLPLVELADFAKLMKIGEIEVFDPEELMFKQGDTCEHIRLMMEGDAVVYRDGVATYGLYEGNFISESGMHSGLEVVGGVESCATAKARTKVRCISWNRTKLMELCLTDKPLYRSLQFALCWDIVRKLKNQRNFLIHEVKDPEQWTIKRKEQTDSRYASILENILQHHGHLEGHQEQLKNYRVMHQIDDEQHLKALKHCGWTPEEYDLGRKEGEGNAIEEIRIKQFVSNLLK